MISLRNVAFEYSCGEDRAPTDADARPNPTTPNANPGTAALLSASAAAPATPNAATADAAPCPNPTTPAPATADGRRLGYALKSTSLSIAQGECLLLAGESGCGKTTLLRLINGLIPQYYDGNLSGEALVDGRTVADTPLWANAETIGTVFQNPRSQFFNVDTESEVAFGCENLGMPPAEIVQRVAQAMADTSVSHLAGRSLFELSGGEKQRIACASVAALRPKLLVLDEPSSNLDMRAIASLRRMVALWKSQGKTIIIAEHRLHYLEGLTDRILLLANGEVIAEHSWESLRSLSPKQRRKLGLRALDLRDLGQDATSPEAGTAAWATDGQGSWDTQSQHTGHVDGVRRPRAKPGLGASQAEARLTLSRFCFSYKRGQRGNPALDIAELELPRDAVIAVIGRNGAGKTSFARCLCGLEKRCPGTLRVSGGGVSGGASVRADGGALTARRRRKRCFMVMQDVNHQLFTESVLDEVLLSMGRRPDPDRALAILNSLRLGEFADTHPLVLSGGQRQRVAIATALASDREIIIFDEPTSGLDMQHMCQVAASIAQLRRDGQTVLVATHDPELIGSCCTHLLRLERGRVVESYPLDTAGRLRMLGFFLDELGAEPGAWPCAEPDATPGAEPDAAPTASPGAGSAAPGAASPGAAPDAASPSKPDADV
jgi:energy-coupling factor transport system ATP-binding protein